MIAMCHKAKQNHQIGAGRYINLRSGGSSWDRQEAAMRKIWISAFFWLAALAFGACSGRAP